MLLSGIGLQPVFPPFGACHQGCPESAQIPFDDQRQGVLYGGGSIVSLTPSSGLVLIRTLLLCFDQHAALCQQGL